jgi:hypothetical protein
VVAENCELTRRQAPVAGEDEAAEELTEYWKKVIKEYGDEALEWRKAYETMKRLSTAKDFFFPAPSHGKTPASFFNLPFIVYAPLRKGVKEILCPACNNHCSPLKLSHPRRVYDIGSQVFYMSEVYQCSKLGCRKCVVGDDPDLMKCFPRAVQAAYPIVKTKKHGITKALESHIMFTATSGSNCSELTKALSEAYATEYQRRVLLYYCSMADARAAFEEKFRAMTSFRFDTRLIEEQPTTPPEKWKGMSPDSITHLTKELARRHSPLLLDAEAPFVLH